MAVTGMVALLIAVLWSHNDTFVFKWCDTNYEHVCSALNCDNCDDCCIEATVFLSSCGVFVARLSYLSTTGPNPIWL